MDFNSIYTSSSSSTSSTTPYFVTIPPSPFPLPSLDSSSSGHSEASPSPVFPMDTDGPIWTTTFPAAHDTPLISNKLTTNIINNVPDAVITPDSVSTPASAVSTFDSATFISEEFVTSAASLEFSYSPINKPADPPVPHGVLKRVLELLTPADGIEYKPFDSNTHGCYGWPGYMGMRYWKSPKVIFMCYGGFNAVWKVTLDPIDEISGSSPICLILRIPIRYVVDVRHRTPKVSESDFIYLGDVRHSILNEAATIIYIRQHVPFIPVPQVYAFDAGRLLCEVPFMAMEFIEGVTLHRMWSTYTADEREQVCQNIANIVTAMAFTEFKQIGGIQLNCGKGEEEQIGPAIEFSRVHGYRRKLFSDAYYDIGPYSSTQDYTLACFDKEISFNELILDTKCHMDFYKSFITQVFLKTLRRSRSGHNQSPETANGREPFVLIHGDMHAGNIIMNGTNISGILDWEFAGAFPLSDLLRRGFGRHTWEFEERACELVLGRVGEWMRTVMDPSGPDPAWSKVRRRTFDKGGGRIEAETII